MLSLRLKIFYNDEKVYLSLYDSGTDMYVCLCVCPNCLQVGG